MKQTAAVLAVVVLVAGLAAPALAQGSGEAKVRFRLHLYGNVPPDQSFEGGFFRDHSDDGMGILFCGEFVKTLSLPKCTGGGVYLGDSPSGGYSVEKGSSIRFSFTRWTGPALGSGESEVFYKGTRTVTGDTTIDAYYCFEGAEASVCGGRMPSALPATGAGGEAFSEGPLADAAHAARQSAKQRITFRLVVNGGVPETHDLAISIGYVGATKLVENEVLCGPSIRRVCRSGVYTRTVETAARGHRLYYIYSLGDPRVDYKTVVFREVRNIAGDTTVTTVYDASSHGQARAPGLPAAGGGGMRRAASLHDAGQSACRRPQPAAGSGVLQILRRGVVHANPAEAGGLRRSIPALQPDGKGVVAV